MDMVPFTEIMKLVISEAKKVKDFKPFQDKFVYQENKK
ncbi:unnamed protein product, partial [Brassica oleracea]